VENFVGFTYTFSKPSGTCQDEIDDVQWRLDADGLHLHLVDVKNVSFQEVQATFDAKPWQKIANQ
jgi:hypothetical protein